MLGVDARRLKVADFTNKVLKMLEPIVFSVLKNESLSVKAEGPLIYTLSIGDKGILLFLDKDKDTGVWKCISPFKSHDFLMAVKLDNGKHLCTAFEICSAEQLAKIVNLNLENVTEQYQKRVDNKDLSYFGTSAVLKFLMVADSCKERRHEFLKAAQRLSLYLCESMPEDRDMEVNLWQTNYRLNGLSSGECKLIRQRRRGLNSDDPNFATLYSSYCFLLDDNDEGLEALLEVGEDVRSEFEKTRIHHLSHFSTGQYHSPTTDYDDPWESYKQTIWKESLTELVKGGGL